VPGHASPDALSGRAASRRARAGSRAALPDQLLQEATLRLSGQTPGPDGLYAKKVVWASTTGEYEGPVVVRVGRIDGAGRGHVRLSYDPGASRGTAVVFVVGDTPGDWPSFTYVSGPGCYAYQLDGRTFTQVIVFRVVA